MSADRWSVCPKCKKKADADKTRQEKKLADSYGKVSLDEYTQLQEVLNVETEPENTLRQDYEQGIDELGGYWVRFSCGCRVCGFNWAYEYTQQVKI